MMIWVDGDGFPKEIRQKLLEIACGRVHITFVAVHPPADLPVGVEVVTVAQYQDSADDYIIHNMKEGDLVISDDGNLGSLAIGKKGQTIKICRHRYLGSGKTKTVFNKKTVQTFVRNLRDFLEQSAHKLVKK